MESTTEMPAWISDSKIDPSWIHEKTSGFGTISDCTVQDISNDTRKGDKVKNGATLLLQLTSEEKGAQKNMTLVAKQLATVAGKQQSVRLGLAREAIFYNELAPKVKVTGLENGNNETPTPCIPKIYYSSGDMNDGSKIVIMEDLSKTFIDSGILFGSGNPNNWNRDLKARILESYPDDNSPSSFEVANQTFLAIANVHATFWRDKSLLKEEFAWLRGSSWVSGKGEDSWKASQGLLQRLWAKMTVEDANIDSRIQWDPLVKEILTKTMDGISWESQLKRLNTDTHFCLVHGDFWPGNVMISTEDNKEIRLLDWEMVGLGSGPQDLGQYIISNMDPSQRRACEETLIRNYHNKLVQLGVEISWEDCWTEYTVGGLERWLWFLVYFCAQNGPLLKWAQFFHDQIKEFVHDHKICPADITQPRP